MKALLTLIIASLVFTSCSTTEQEKDQLVPRRVKVPTTNIIIVRYIDTMYKANDTMMVGIGNKLERVVVQ